MDSHRFDALSRAVASGSTRRGVLKALFAAALGSLAGGESADAALCRSAGSICSRAGDCCSGGCLPPDHTGRRHCAKALGERAFNPAECASGIVADGVCCSNACTGQCEACNLPGKAGDCSPVSGAPQNGRPACAGSGTCAGTCDGAERTACAYPGGGTTCAAPTCNGNGDAVTYACDGKGDCGSTTTHCGLYVCANGACKTRCASDGDCIGAAYCNGGVCAADLPNGQPCGERGQCQSGNCVDGVCCAATTCSECQSCASGNGTCGNVADGIACSNGFCRSGICCPIGQKACNGECIHASACCTDADCGPSGITCQAQACAGGSCVYVNIDSDPGCASDACFSRACLSGTCVETRTGCCPAGQKLCGADCIPQNDCCADADCAAECLACQGGQCVESCPTSTLACQESTGHCAPDGSCYYVDLCPACQQCGSAGTCQPQADGTQVPETDGTVRQCCGGQVCGPCGQCGPNGSCVPVPDYTKITINGVASTCCSGIYFDDSKLCYGAKTCPFVEPGTQGELLTCCDPFNQGICCPSPNVVLQGVCCPVGTMSYTNGVCITSTSSYGNGCSNGQGQCGSDCCDSCYCDVFGCRCT